MVTRTRFYTPHPSFATPQSLIFRGVLSIVFGFLTLFFPLTTLFALALWFGAYAFVDGVIAATTVLGRSTRRGAWGWRVVEALIGIGTGIAVIVWPGITLIELAGLLAVWLLLTGIAEIYGAAALKRYNQITTRCRALLAAAGMISVFAGLALLLWSGLEVLTLTGLIAAYAWVFGGVITALGVRLRKDQASRSRLSEEAEEEDRPMAA